MVAYWHDTLLEKTDRIGPDHQLTHGRNDEGLMLVLAMRKLLDGYKDQMWVVVLGIRAPSLDLLTLCMIEVFEGLEMELIKFIRPECLRYRSRVSASARYICSFFVKEETPETVINP